MKNVFKNLSIKTKLRLSYASILIFIIALSIISITEITLVGKDLRNVSDNELKSKDAILNIRIDLNTASSIIREMIIETHSQTEVDKVLILKEEYDKAVVRINENFTILKNNNVLDSQYIAEYNTLLNDWINKAQKVIGAVEQNDSLKATNLMKEEEIPALLLIEKEAKKMSTDINEFSNLSLTNTIKASNRVTKVVFYTTLIAIIIVIYTYLKITSYIIKPVLEVSEVANKLSNGVLDTTVTYEGNDELGVMAEGVRNTNILISGTVEAVENGSNNGRHSKCKRKTIKSSRKYKRNYTRNIISSTKQLSNSRGKFSSKRGIKRSITNIKGFSRRICIKRKY